MASVEEIVNKATNKNNTCEDWASIIEICDLAQNGKAREIVNCLKKKIMDQNSNTILYALTVSDSLVKNCHIEVHREISSRGFLDVLVKQLSNRDVHEIVKERILYLIQQWKTTFSYNDTLSYCNEVYKNLKSQNYKFSEPRPLRNKDGEKKKNESLVAKEDEDLQLALALSLSSAEANNSTKSTYKKFSPPDSVILQHSQPNKPLFKVKALYDFLGNYAEGELPLYRGDIVNVYDTTFKDWWKGENRGMVGIFPNNYVEKISDSSITKPVDDEYESQVIRESQKIDEFMQILATIDPKTENLSENDELQNMYNAICTLRPKLVKLVEFYSKKKEESTLLTKKFMQAESTYQRLSDASRTYNPPLQNYVYSQPPQAYQNYYAPSGIQQPPQAIIGQYAPPPQQPYNPQMNPSTLPPQVQQPPQSLPPQQQPQLQSYIP